MSSKTMANFFIYLRPQELDYRDGWTEEKANKTCTERLKTSIPSDIPNVPGLLDYDYIQSCMLDIKVISYYFTFNITVL